MLLQAHAGFHRTGADDQEARNASKSFGEGGFVIEIGVADLDTLGFKIGQLGWFARAGDNLGCWHFISGEKVVDGGAAQMACRSGYENHDVPFRVGLSPPYSHCLLYTSDAADDL